MKTRIIAGALLLAGFGLWGWTACDKIADDEMRISSDLPEWQGKTIVLEDFTGVGCTNCPDAADIAHGLQTLMGDRLIVVELHAKTTAIGDNLTAPRAEGDADLRCADAVVYSEFWKVTGLPSGLINRQQESGESLPRARWRGLAISAYGEVPAATIEAAATLSGSTISVSANGIFPKSYACSDVRVMAMVLEDGFVVTQVKSGQEVAGYMHDHVLRKTLDEAWGKNVLTSVPTDSTTYTYSGSVSVDPAWNPANLSVAVMVCNGETKEILNATKVSFN